MTSLLKKIGASSLLFLVFCALFAPMAAAQGNGLFDTLDTIKTKVGEGEGGIKIVDFSQGRTWGNLPKETQSILIDDGYDSLGAIIDLYNAPENSDKDLIKFISNPDNKLEGLVDEDGIPNEHGKRLISEIAYQGESQLQAVILAVAKVFRNLMGAVAMVVIVVSGILMVFAQGDEAKITEQKRSITFSIIGLAVILIIERLIASVYGVAGEERVLTKETATMVDLEIYGLVSYLKAILGSVAIFMIVLSGIRTVASQGDETEITNQRKAILWTIVGLVLIVVNQVLVENIFIKPVRESADKIRTENVDAVLGLFGRVTQFILGFVGLVAFAALVYGAATLVANFGNEEAVDKAKKIIKNAIIGIVIILSAFAIVSTMIL